MIRGSAVIAAIAVLISLLLHALGLGFTAPRLAEQPRRDNQPETVLLGNTFEDVTDASPQPVQPEPAAVREPPVETPPEPEQAEVPISDALVASADPQQVASPDTGTSAVAQPEPIQPETAEAADQVDTDEETTATPPVEQEAIAETPAGAPEASEAPVEPVAAPSPSPPASQQLAALPVPAETVVPAPSEVPVVPLEEIETLDPESTNEPVPDEPDTSEAEDEAVASDLAVVTSPRPRLPERRPSEVQNGPRDFSALRNPTQLVESPITVYRRDGTDTFTRRGGESRSGGRGPGNSNVTNYAGQVLVHLNRAPPVYVASKGFAQVFFEINPDGTLAWVDVVDNSGSQDVNRAAKAQVRSAAPFPPPPGGVSRKLSFYYQNS